MAAVAAAAAVATEKAMAGSHLVAAAVAGTGEHMTRLISLITGISRCRPC